MTKLVDLFEKCPAEFDAVLYCAAAQGRLSLVTSVVLSIAGQEKNKDAVFGLAFLVLFRMIAIFGQKAIVKVGGTILNTETPFSNIRTCRTSIPS